MFVSCCYDVYNSPEKVAMYFRLFEPIAHSGLPIIFYTDPSLVSYTVSYPSTVTVVLADPTECELYRIAMNYKGELPGDRNPEKDTQKYLALMNAKMDWMKKAAEQFPKVETFFWIDAGIMKLIKNAGPILTALRTIHQINYEHIIMPGSWEFNARFNVNAANWRFCGTFLVLPRIHLDFFYERCKNVLIDFCKNYKLTWEVNIWTIVEYYCEKKIFQWYYAGHDDGLIMNFFNR